MEIAVFVDTSAWYALVDADDAHHAEAQRQLQQVSELRRDLVTTNHVVAETYTLLLVRLGGHSAQEFLVRLRSSAIAERVFVPPPWEEAAEELLVLYRDHPFSYVDATSFVAMRRLGLQEALAFDRHFAAAGFTVLGGAAAGEPPPRRPGRRRRGHRG